MGQRYLAVVTDTQNQAMFYAGKRVWAKADHYARLRKRLQRTGTRASTRRLVVIAGRERRLKQDRNHHISRRIVDAYPQSLIGLEQLTDIRERAGRRHGKHASHAAAQGQSACLAVGLCRIAGLPRLQGAALRQHGCEGRCLQDQPSLPALRSHHAGAIDPARGYSSCVMSAVSRCMRTWSARAMSH